MSINFPVEACPVRATSCTNLQQHLMHRNAEDTIVVLNEGPVTHPWCKQCNMFIPQEAIAAIYLGTEMCERRAEQKYRRLATTTSQVSTGTEIRAQD